MSHVTSFARKYGFDVLIVLAATAAVLEVALRVDPLRAPQTPLWFAVPAAALVVLPLLLRRRFPFAAPATLWLLAAALSFIDGRLIVFPYGVYFAGIAASFLLGNLRDAVQARIGLAIVVIATAIVVYNDPSRTAGVFVLIPGS